MTNTNNIIITMINQNKSLNEICETTNLSSKQLFYRLYLLKLKGYNFNREYYYNGDIRYRINKSINMSDDVVLLNDIKDDKFRVLIISDLHLANNKERIDLLNKVYDFAIVNGYNIIINAGDVIDGLIGNFKDKKFTDIVKQIEYVLKVYPYDRNILNFICFGNHDLDAYNKSAINIESALEIKRHDLVSLGYGYGELFVRNDKIIVTHPKTIKIDNSLLEKGLIISGHLHSIGYTENGNARMIKVNSLSNIGDKTIPGFMTLNSIFNNDKLDRVTIESFLFINDNFIKTSEYNCNVSQGKNRSDNINVPKKELIKNNNQIEKFNKKYNR